jgi:hypothetical protein
MPNAIKYSVSSETLALKKGDFYIGTNDVGKGPTSSTGYYNGIIPPVSGYTIYLNKESNGPSIYTVATDGELVSLTNTLAGASYTTPEQCLSYYVVQTDKMCFNLDYEQIITDGLVLNLDAGFTPSYPKNGTTWYDLSLSGSNSSLVNGPTYVSNNYGGISFDGSNDTVTTPLTLSSVAALSNFTMSCWVQINSAPTNSISNGVIFGSTYYCGTAIYWTSSAGSGTFTIYGFIRGADLYRTTSLYTLTLGNIYNFTIVNRRSDNKFMLYVNGVLYSTVAGPTQEYNPSLVSSAGNIGINKAQIDGGGAQTYTYFNGNIYNAMIYSRALSDSEVLINYNAQKGRYVNFYTNGDFKRGNYNFSAGIANASVTLNGAPYSLQLPQIQYATFTSDYVVQVDTTKNYQMTVNTRTLTKGGPGDDILSGGHTGFMTFDSSLRFIDLRMCGGIANTVLTRPLNPGDEYAYVSNENNQWSAPGSTYYFRHFMVYPPLHPEFGFKWTYTRIGYGDVDIYYNEITDIGGGELRFRFADSSGNWTTFPNIGYATPAGTGVMNGVAGGTFNYVFYPTTGAYGSWSEYVSDIFTGENRNSSTPFRYGTKYILFMHLINYAVPGGTSPLPIMLFGKTELKQII